LGFVVDDVPPCLRALKARLREDPIETGNFPWAGIQELLALVIMEREKK